MFFNVTRRRIIANSAFLPIILSSVQTGRAIASDHSESTDLAVLWHRRTELIAECQRLDQKWQSAHEKLPFWCKPGPKYLTELGEPAGPNVGWPAWQADFIQLSKANRLLRPSPYDLRQLFEAETLNLSRNMAISNYRIRSKQLRARLRKRREIILEIGMPRTSDWLPLEAEIEHIDAAIAALAAVDVALAGAEAKLYQ